MKDRDRRSREEENYVTEKVKARSYKDKKTHYEIEMQHV